MDLNQQPHKKISYEEAALIKGVSKQTIFNWIRDGKINKTNKETEVEKFKVIVDEKFENISKTKQFQSEKIENLIKENFHLKEENKKLKKLAKP